MKVRFQDKRLEAVETEDAGNLRLPVAVIGAARKKLHVLRSAPDERTLRNWRSLHYEKLSGDRKGQRSIRLNDQWRLTFQLDSKTEPPTILVLSIEDYH